MKKGVLQSFILDNAANKKLLILAIVASLVQFSIFKYLYPYPDFISDSYSYISTNLFHMKVNLWPAGYSWFLAFIHSISPSHVLLVSVQYLIQQAVLLYFFFSILYLYPLSRTSTYILFLFLFLNPIFLYLANCVLSDSLFLSLSLILLTQYLWMFRKPKLSHLAAQALVIGAAFILRYTAIYYPFVAIVALLCSGYKPLLKLAGVISPWLIILPFILYTQQQTKKITGTPEFSVFGGWQIANNALYMYSHIEVNPAELPAETRALDTMAKQYFRYIAPHNPPLQSIQGTYYIKMPNAILKPYYQKQTPESLQRNPADGFRAWGKVSPVYKTYGTWLIKHYPLAFARYYLWLNTTNYFYPYLEKFEVYHVDMDHMWPIGLAWFQLADQPITPRPGKYFQGTVFALYPLLFMLLNIMFIAYLALYLLNRKKQTSHNQLSGYLLLTGSFLVFNFGFSVFATPVVLRYQLVPMILLVTSLLLLIEAMLSAASRKEGRRQTGIRPATAHPVTI